MSHPLLTDAGGKPVSALPGACTFDSAMSFGLIRGGHLDMTVLGALQVDGAGNLANWMIPGKMVPGMGGAMDLVTGAKRVIVAMQHTAKGQPKIVKQCSLPLTSVRPVDLVVTELAVIGFPDGARRCSRRRPGVTVEQVREATEAELAVIERICHHGALVHTAPALSRAADAAADGGRARRTEIDSRSVSVAPDATARAALRAMEENDIGVPAGSRWREAGRRAVGTRHRPRHGPAPSHRGARAHDDARPDRGAGNDGAGVHRADARPPHPPSSGGELEQRARRALGARPDGRADRATRAPAAPAARRAHRPCSFPIQAATEDVA